MNVLPANMTVKPTVGPSGYVYLEVEVKGSPTPEVLEACRALTETREPVLFNFWNVDAWSSSDGDARQEIYEVTEGVLGVHPVTTASYTCCSGAEVFHARMGRWHAWASLRAV